MLTLFVKDHCRHSKKVIDALRKLELPYEEKNIKEITAAEELLERGGKRQVPFLVDEDLCKMAEHHAPCLIDGDVELYESEDIVKYLNLNYGKE